MLPAQRSWQSLRDPAAAPASLDRIVVNECRDRLRRRRVARTVLNAQHYGPEPVDWTDDLSRIELARSPRHLPAGCGSPHRGDPQVPLDLPEDAIAARTRVLPGRSSRGWITPFDSSAPPVWRRTGSSRARTAGRAGGRRWLRRSLRLPILRLPSVRRARHGAAGLPRRVEGSLRDAEARGAARRVRCRGRGRGLVLLVAVAVGAPWLARLGRCDGIGLRTDRHGIGAALSTTPAGPTPPPINKPGPIIARSSPAGSPPSPRSIRPWTRTDRPLPVDPQSGGAT